MTLYQRQESFHDRLGQHRVAGRIGMNAVTQPRIDCRRSGFLQGDHGLHVLDDGVHGAALVLCRIRAPQLQSGLVAHAVGYVAVDGVVRRGLVGDDVGHHACGRPGAHHEDDRLPLGQLRPRRRDG